MKFSEISVGQDAVKRGASPAAGVSNLQNIGSEFLDLFDHVNYNEVVAHILGEETVSIQSPCCSMLAIKILGLPYGLLVLLQNAIIFNSPFHLDGFLARDLHTDTWWMPPP